MNHMIDERTRSCDIYGLSSFAHDSAAMALHSHSRQTLGEDVCRLPVVAVLDVPAAAFSDKRVSHYEEQAQTLAVKSKEDIEMAYLLNHNHKSSVESQS